MANLIVNNAKVMSKGQITLPKEIRTQLGIDTGYRVTLICNGDQGVMMNAAVYAKVTPYKAFLKAVTHPNKGLICDQNIEELRRIFNRKFPNKINVLEHFFLLHYLQWK